MTFKTKEGYPSPDRNGILFCFLPAISLMDRKILKNKKDTVDSRMKLLKNKTCNKAGSAI